MKNKYNMSNHKGVTIERKKVMLITLSKETVILRHTRAEPSIGVRRAYAIVDINSKIL